MPAARNTQGENLPRSRERTGYQHPPLLAEKGARVRKGVAVQLTWGQAVREGAAQLQLAGVDSPLHDAQELATAAGLPPAHQAPSSNAVSPQQLAEFRRLLERRIRREPLQHILGTMWFRYLELEARPGVFIVRPETEMVAQAGINYLKQRYDRVRAHKAAMETGAGVANAAELSGDGGLAGTLQPLPAELITVDLFSGSGAIALSIATELAELRAPHLEVVGVESSAVAFASAERNNARYGNPVHFIQADALAPLPDPFEVQLRGRVALVIANPPYVPAYHQLSPEVQADPKEALWGGGADGLDIPLRTIARASELLAPGGALVMEHASEQAEALRAAAVQAGFTAVSTGRDLAGELRWLQAER